MTASFVLANHDGDGRGAVFLAHHAGEHLYVGLPGRLKCGYNGSCGWRMSSTNPTTDIRKDRLQQVHARVWMRGMVANFGGSFH